MIGPKKLQKIYTSDGHPENDAFHRKGFAQRVVTTILQQPLGDCLVVSIVGPWGSGKTTVLKYIHEEIAARTSKEGTCLIAPFNPWRFTGEDTLLFELFDALVKAIDPEATVLKEWQIIKEKLASFSDAVGASLAAVTNAKAPGFGKVMSALTSALLPSNWKAKLEDVKGQAADYLVKQEKRVVVLLDDVDRLDAADLLLIFRILKLSADLPNTTFVIAMDEEHVSQVISERISSTNETGRRYIEKIVNVRIALPTIPHHVLSSYTLQLLSDVIDRTDCYFPDEDSRRVRNIFQKLHAPFVKTPRTAKAVQNAFAFALGLLPEEVNAGDVLLLETTRLLHPLLYEALKEVIPTIGEDFDLADIIDRANGQERKKKKIDLRWAKLLKGFVGLDDVSLDGIREAIMEWFPQLYTHVQDGDSLEWTRSRRICARSYFWRYFSGAIQEDDIRDEVVREWVEKSRLVNDESSMQLKEHLEKPYNRAFLDKLEDICFAPGFNPEYVMKDLAKVGGGLSVKEKDRLTGSVRQRSLEIAARLVKHIEEKQRERVLLECMTSSEDLGWTFAMWKCVPRNALNIFTQSKDNKNHHISSVDLRLANLSLEKYETSRFPETNELITDMIWSITRNIRGNGIKRRLKKLVTNSPRVGLHLLISNCSFGSSHATHSACWNWQGGDVTNKFKALIDQKCLKVAVTKELANISTTGKTKINDDADYQTLEDLGRIYLEAIKLQSKRRKLKS